METIEGPRFRQGAGRLCLDYGRTLRYRGLPQQREELVDPDAVSAWLRQFGPDLGQLLPTNGQVREAQRLREAIYALVLAAVGPGVGACRASARERVNRTAASAIPAPRLTATGQMHWRAEDPVVAMFSAIARDALDLVASPAIDRVRECAGETCCALFLDSSRPGARRWCGMDVCGNQAKKRVLRSKAVLG